MSLDLQLAAKISYGLSPQQAEKVRKIGFEKYLQEQLQPKDAEDARYTERHKLGYTVDREKKQENRQFSFLKMSGSAILQHFSTPTAKKERRMPAFEVYADTCLRVVYSDWQLREMLVDFWHNHFSINAQSNDDIAQFLPLYDAVMRQNAFGNFRTLLEAVAKSPAMLYYLNNNQSKASPANENYARELFELHTLGADSYLNHLYNRWREVPGALEGKPQGYIDEDVYEAARAFTGWTVGDGSKTEKGGSLPLTGEFSYFEGWHDHYQKRVLGVEFAPNQPALADGQRVLDLCALHPATALHLSRKLCRRFLSDQPDETFVQKVAEVWTQHQKSPDQIRRVLQFILSSEQFRASLNQKSRRPLELLAALARALQLDFRPNQRLVDMLNNCAHTLFGYPAPTGHPDSAEFWHSPNLLLTRWNTLLSFLLEDWHQLTDTAPVFAQIPPKMRRAQEIALFFLQRLLPAGHSERLFFKCANYLAGGGDTDEEPIFHDERERRWRILNMIGLIALSPEFQTR